MSIPVKALGRLRAWFWAHWASGTAMSLLVLGMVAVTWWAERASERSDLLAASAQARSVARQLAERTAQLLGRADQLSSLAAARPGQLRARELLIDGPGHSAVLLLDRHGRIEDSTLGHWKKGADVRHQAYFKAARGLPSHMQLVHPQPLVPGGQVMLPLVRPLRGAQGEFAGAIVIALRPEHIVGALHLPKHPQALFALLDSQGQVLAGKRAGLPMPRLRLTPADRAVLARSGRNGGVLPVLTGPVDMRARLTALQQVPAYPFQVLAGVPVASATEDAQALFRVVHWAVAFLCAGLLVGTVLVQRQQQRLKDAFEAQGRAQEALGEEKQFLDLTLGSIDDGVITLDNAQRITFLNRRAEVMTGWLADAAVGRPLAEVVVLEQLHLAHGSLADVREREREPVDMATLGANARGVAELSGRCGSTLVVEYAVMALAQRHSGTHAVLVLHDVSQATQMAHTLSYQASHDALTGLLNRTAFDARVELALESAAREEREHVLLFLDLDQFKVVNDSCGHAAGDELLKQIAFLFMQLLRQNDMLARMGGDEFAVLLQDCPASAALRLADKLRAELTAFRFAWAGKTFQVGVSIGAVPINAASGNRDELMRRADAACYIAKDSGRNRTHLYLDCDEAVLARRGELSWAARVQRALVNDEFVLQGQRIVSPQGGAGHYYEMLVRLREADGTLVPPMAFLPAAERYGLMPAIDRAVIDKALAAHRELQGVTGEPVKFGVNLSGASLSDPALLEFIQDALARHQVKPECICFELTETVAIANLQVAAKLMGQLRDMGCTLALDDFGSGMSSFSYLKQLPVDVVKIDGSFVRNMLGSSADYAMVEAVNNIAHQMGMATLAEYVETPALMAALESMGVDLLQGYGVGRPESLAAMRIAVQGAPTGGAAHPAQLRARA